MKIWIREKSKYVSDLVLTKFCAMIILSCRKRE